ncbi:MAG: DUF1749 domain-containing protein [Patescibacteria group bacterium]
MTAFSLVETVTKDKIIHQGIFYKPKKTGKRAILWIHGLTGTFYGNKKILEEFAKECNSLGYGFTSFNNRGHDIVTGLKKIDKRKPKGYTRINGGAGYEIFKDCIYDIEAGINFLVAQGFSETVVIGHSTGSQKLCYFAGSKQNPHLFGVILASPASDRLDPALNRMKLTKDLALMQDLVNKGKGEELVLGYHVFPATPKRFLSSFLPNSLEDQFDYGDPRPRMKYFSKITKPLLVIIGGQDEYLDRSASVFMKTFDNYQHSVSYKSIILKDAYHSYNGDESRFVKTVLLWVSTL